MSDNDKSISRAELQSAVDSIVSRLISIEKSQRDLEKSQRDIEKNQNDMAETLRNIAGYVTEQFSKNETKSELRFNKMMGHMTGIDKIYGFAEEWRQEKMVLGSQVDRANHDNIRQDCILEDHEGRIREIET